MVSGKYQNNNNNKENNFLNLIYYAKYKRKLNIIKLVKKKYILFFFVEKKKNKWNEVEKVCKSNLLSLNIFIFIFLYLLFSSFCPLPCSLSFFLIFFPKILKNQTSHYFFGYKLRKCFDIVFGNLYNKKSNLWKIHLATSRIPSSDFSYF